MTPLMVATFMLLAQAINAHAKPARPASPSASAVLHSVRAQVDALATMPLHNFTNDAVDLFGANLDSLATQPEQAAAGLLAKALSDPSAAEPIARALSAQGPAGLDAYIRLFRLQSFLYEMGLSGQLAEALRPLRGRIAGMGLADDPAKLKHMLDQLFLTGRISAPVVVVPARRQD